MLSDSRLRDVARTSAARASHIVSESRQRTAAITATLSAELDGRVPPGLVDEIVRATLDESRQAVPGPAAELTMVVARQRLERFIRARASR